MFSIVRFLTVISIVVILISIVVNSLPQNVFNSENIDLASVKPDQSPNSISAGVNQDTASNVFDIDAFDTNDEDIKEPSSVSNDVEYFDSTLNMNTEPDFNEKEPIAIANIGETTALCLNENDKNTGALSGRDINEACPPGYVNGRTEPHSMGIKEWIKKYLPKPRKEGEHKNKPHEKAPPANDGRCPPPWSFHLCGDGPESDIGRTDIPNWPIHRTTVANMFFATPILCTSSLWEVCCEYFDNPYLEGYGWVGVNCLVVKGVDYPAPKPEPPNLPDLSSK